LGGKTSKRKGAVAIAESVRLKGHVRRKGPKKNTRGPTKVCQGDGPGGVGP